MKKVILALMVILLIFQANTVALAADNFVVSADKVKISSTAAELVSVKLKSNKGIMGFKITAEYEPDKIDIKSVSRGTVTSKGNFNTNLGAADGKFDVIWNNTSEIQTDGTLFVLSVCAQKSGTIKLSFSQADTFNEKYEDVKLVCKNIDIERTENNNNQGEVELPDLPAEEITKKPEVTTKDEPNDPNTKNNVTADNSQIIDAIDTALIQGGYNSISDVKDSKKFINQVNKNLEIITGSKKFNAFDIDSLKSLYNTAYEKEFVKETIDNIDSKNIDKAIDNALDSVGEKSINKIPEDKKAEFVKLVEDNLKSSNSDIPDISTDVSTDDALSIIESLSKFITKDSTSESSNLTIFVFITVIAAVFSCIIAFIVKKKSRKERK